MCPENVCRAAINITSDPMSPTTADDAIERIDVMVSDFMTLSRMR